MQPNVKPRVASEGGSAFRVLHKYHRAGRVDSIRGKARYDPISSQHATAKIISIYGKHELRDRELNRGNYRGTIGDEHLVQQSALE
jgi:hypothetical protein